MDIPLVGCQGDHPEQAAQDILPFRDPDDRFGMEGMNSEHGRDEGAFPPASGQCVEREKEQDRVCGVDQEIGQMVRACASAEKLHVGHIGNPGQGKPHGSRESRGCPSQSDEAQAAVDPGVVRDDDIVVETSERVAADRPVNREG